MNYERIKTFSREGVANAIIETPKGSRSKYYYNASRGIFELKKVLPLGAVFPYNFGFLPGTIGGDGDPLDILVLMDDASFPGCLIPCRVLGVIRAKNKKKESGETERNDRLIGVPDDALSENNLHSIDDLNENIIREIGNFFTFYHAQRGNVFTTEGAEGPEAALKMIKEGQRKDPSRYFFWSRKK